MRQTSLITWARATSGFGDKRSGKTEFSSQQALQTYLRQHPKADASKHSVVQQKQQQAQKEEPSRKTAQSHGHAVSEKARAETKSKIETLAKQGKVAGSYDALHKEGVEFLKKHAAGLPASKSALTELSADLGGKVSGRTKEIDSALNKVVLKHKGNDPSRPEKGYSKVSELADGAGLRCIVNSPKDVLTVVDRLKKDPRFENISKDEEDYITKPKGGYRSYHLVMRDKRDGLLKEFQIRTPRQNTWGDWCHDVYKPQNALQMATMKDPLAKREVLAYAEKMSDRYFDMDSGKKPRGSAPPCTPAIKKSFGCLPDK
jgi:ppGpp synthetase/RelA/SpoT-type nucleotidyltranferase